jgi:hypothetical protein
MAVDKDQASAIFASVNDVGVPDFFVECARLIHTNGLKAQQTVLGKQGTFDATVDGAFCAHARKAAGNLACRPFCTLCVTSKAKTHR